MSSSGLPHALVRHVRIRPEPSFRNDDAPSELAAVALTLILVTGCVRTYRIDVQQGNVVSKAQLDQVQTGMTRAEVKFLLGSPLVADPFHSERWDYYFSFKSGETKETEQRHLTLYLKTTVSSR
ncbi:MAG: hypothetical protein CM1200mP41_38140 [Gammaproteobacteria bacterium]|nr:MAG: hypothetical protein CM1200mP41_38140 [Gammaproteobacteria bacterium]